MFPSPLSISPAPALTDESTLEATLDCLMEQVSIQMQGDCSPQTLFEVLLRAASHHDSIEHTTEILDGTPTGNGIHHHLNKLDAMVGLETQVNTTLQSRAPSQYCSDKIIFRFSKL